MRADCVQVRPLNAAVQTFESRDEGFQSLMVVLEVGVVLDRQCRLSQEQIEREFCQIIGITPSKQWKIRKSGNRNIQQVSKRDAFGHGRWAEFSVHGSEVTSRLQRRDRLDRKQTLRKHHSLIEWDTKKPLVLSHSIKRQLRLPAK